jgi:hypothetical protein
MKFLKKFAIIIVTICIILNIVMLSASAAKNAVLHFSKSTVNVGDKVTVTVSMNPGTAMYAVGFYLEYNSDVLKYTGGAGTGDAGVLKVIESPSGDKSVKYNFNFTALKAGASTIAVSDCVYDVLGSNGAETVKFGGASAKITVKDAALSSNAKLKSLTVSGYSISPSFSSTRTSYTLKVPNNVTKINVNATAEDEDAKVVSVEGNDKLKVGSNTVTVTVQAASGTQKKYTIKVTRQEEEKEETSSKEETTEETDTSLETNIQGVDYLLATKIPKKVLFKGFDIETTKVNGYDIETAVDEEGNYRIFYLQPADSDDLIPYLYNQDLDEFEKLKYIVYNDRTYIFESIPEDLNLSASMYESTINFEDFSVECLADSASELSDFRYVYCYSEGYYSIYRYDNKENTWQRYPDLQLNATTDTTQNETFFTKFSSLSTNGKVIFTGLVILVVGVFALLILLVLYLINKSKNVDDEVILTSADIGFDDISINSNK